MCQGKARAGGAPGACCGCEGGGPARYCCRAAQKQPETHMASGYEKQETPQQGPVQHHRLSDIASSPRVLESSTLAPQTPGTPRGRGGIGWGLLCCRRLGHRWSVCQAQHGAPPSHTVLFQQDRGHIIPVRWARDLPLHKHLHRAGKRLEQQLEGAPN